MMLELLLIPILLIASFALIATNYEKSIYVLLVLSLLLHKEVFSIYKWDVLPVRIFMLALLCFVAYMLYKKIKDIGVKGLFVELKENHFLTLLFTLWIVRGVSIVNTKNLESSIFTFGFFTTVLALGYILLTSFKQSPQKILNYIRFYILLVFLASLFGLFQLYLYETKEIIIGALWNIPGNIARVGSTFWDVNHFGGLLAVIMPVLGVFILTDTGKKRLLNVFVFLVLLALLLLTSSRTAWIAAFVAFLSFVSILVYKKFNIKGIFVVVLTIVLISIPFVLSYQNKQSAFRAKVKDYFHYRIDSFDSHLLLLTGSIQVFEKYPLIGGGYGSFFEHFSKTEVAPTLFGRDPAALNTRVPAHTVWGELLSETGILGFTTFSLLYLYLVAMLLYGALTTKDIRQTFILAAMASAIIGWAFGSIFYSYNAEFYWLILFFYFIYGRETIHNKKLTEIVSFFCKTDKLYLSLLTILSIILLFIGLGKNHLLPWDEAIYAEIAKNMLVSGDYAHMNWLPNTVWYEKPPMHMWLMSFSMNVFGISEFAARFPSAVLGFATVLLVYFFGKRLFSKLTGFISALALLTTFQFLYYSRSSMLDVGVTFFITLCLYLFYLAQNRTKLTYWLFMGISMGTAVMIKGVIGFLPLLVFGIYEMYVLFIVKEKITKIKIKNYLVFILFSVIVFMPWHILMYFEYGTAFIKNYIGYHVLDRATSAIEDKGRPIWWYLIVLKVSMRIWFVALLGAFPYFIYTAVTDKVNKKYIYILLSALTIFIFFSIAKSKLVWYIMPLYPILAIIVGNFIANVFRFISFKSNVKLILYVFLLLSGTVLYLFLNRGLVYTSDLTGKQAQLLMLKDELFGTNDKVYADRIELPLILYYSDSPYEVVDYGPLKDILANASYSEEIIFITKESRYRSFLPDYQRLKLVKQIDEWVLVSLISQKELDKKLLKDLQKDFSKNYSDDRVNLDISIKTHLENQIRELEQKILNN